MSAQCQGNVTRVRGTSFPWPHKGRGARAESGTVESVVKMRMLGRRGDRGQSEDGETRKGRGRERTRGAAGHDATQEVRLLASRWHIEATPVDASMLGINRRVLHCLDLFRQAAQVDRLGGSWAGRSVPRAGCRIYLQVLFIGKDNTCTQGLLRRRLLAQMNCGRGGQRRRHWRRARFSPTSLPSCRPPSFRLLPSCPRPSCRPCSAWGALCACAVLSGCLSARLPF